MLVSRHRDHRKRADALTQRLDDGARVLAFDHADDEVQRPAEVHRNRSPCAGVVAAVEPDGLIGGERGQRAGAEALHPRGPAGGANPFAHCLL